MSPISRRIFSFGVVLILHTEVKLLLLFLQLMWLTAGDFDHILLDTVSLQCIRTFVQMCTVFEWARVHHFGFRELRPDNTGKKETSRTRSKEIKHLLLNNKMLLLLLKELAKLLALQVRIRLHDIISLVFIYVLCFQEFQLKSRINPRPINKRRNIGNRKQQLESVTKRQCLFLNIRKHLNRVGYNYGKPWGGLQYETDKDARRLA